MKKTRSKTLIKCEISNCVDLCSGVRIVWSTTTRTRVSMSVMSLSPLKQAVRLGGRHNMPPPPVTLTFDLLTLKSVWESHVTWGTHYPCAKFRLSRPFGFRVRADVRDIRQTDGPTDDGRRSPLNAPPPTGREHNNELYPLSAGSILGKWFAS